MSEGFVAKRQVLVRFTDQHGEERTIHKRPGGPLRLKNTGDTPVLRINRVAGVLTGLKIRERRMAAGLSMAALCTKAGLVAANPKARMREIEVGERLEGIRLGTLFAIAAALNCTPGDILPSVEEVLTAAKIEMASSPALTVLK